MYPQQYNYQQYPQQYYGYQYQQYQAQNPYMQQMYQQPQPQRPELSQFLKSQNYNQIIDTNQNQPEQPKSLTRLNKELILTDKMYQIVGMLPPPSAIKDTNQIIKEKEWPSELKLLIEKSYEKCLNRNDQLQMKQLLKEIINAAEQKNELYTKIWANENLPLLPRELQPKESLQMFRISDMKKQTIGGYIPPPPPILNPANGDSTLSQIIKDQKLQPLGMFSVSDPKKTLTITDQTFQYSNKFQSGLQQPMMNLNQTQEKQAIWNRISQANQNKFKRANEAINEYSKQPYTGENPYKKSQYDKTNLDFESMAERWSVQGTCQDLEKKYLRMTQAPDPSQIRPENILKKSLILLLNKWKNQECDYAYLQDQFRSIRQDLLVQHIRNEFTVKAIEHNARICLECHDIMHFLSCCTNLKQLYKEGIKGNVNEFQCYKMLYYHLHGNWSEFSSIIAELNNLDDKLIKWALEFISSLNSGNLYKIFKMYKMAPEMTPFVIDVKLEDLRIKGMRSIMKNFGQEIDLEYLLDLFKFNDMGHLKEFLISNNCILPKNAKILNIKQNQKIAFQDAFQ